MIHSVHWGKISDQIKANPQVSLRGGWVVRLNSDRRIANGYRRYEFWVPSS